MNLKLDESQILNLLKSLRDHYLEAKSYYRIHKDNYETIGIISPEEWKATYNNILSQAHKEGLFTMLKLIP
ncbi:hypothetical protein FDF74_02855 [Clostridium niameyense]|uniref:Uncharacterized protein n=1 Tax=Clostridium niameyense TaxID=1622073 RepID=A0A6M0R991_9CLOT|nr:hypothetical protein [Clostridium niameyense]NEZ46149.1 hypothetical protein [Clostridium niameyense]